MGTVQKSLLVTDESGTHVQTRSSKTLGEIGFKNKKKQSIDKSKSYHNKYNESTKQTHSDNKQSISIRMMSRENEYNKIPQSSHSSKSSRTINMFRPSKSSSPNSSSSTSSLTTQNTKNLKIIKGKHNDEKEFGSTPQERDHTAVRAEHSAKKTRSRSSVLNFGTRTLNSKSMPKVVLNSISQTKIRDRGSSTTKGNVLDTHTSNTKLLEKIECNKDILSHKAGLQFFQSEEKKTDGHRDVDDYEDYESDFQECTDSDESQVIEEFDETLDSFMHMDPIELSTQKKCEIVRNAESPHKIEEERMLDSGHYELTEARKRAAKRETIIITSLSPMLLQPSNSTPHRDEKFSGNKSLLLSMDEGFEDERRSGDFTKSSLSSRISYINFPKPVHIVPVSKQGAFKEPNRGQQLLEMIKLDEVEWSLLECAPVAYEEFIRSYGKLNTRQIATQTAEDDVHSEVQTDEIICANKWTQFPIMCRKNLRTKEDLHLFQMEQLGVGSDNYKAGVDTTAKPPYFDVLRLNDFLNQAGKVILSLLDERKFGGNVRQADTHGLLFSEGSMKLVTNSITFLSGRPVTILHYSEISNKILLTIHLPINEHSQGIQIRNKQDYIIDCCIGCVWNISEPSVPVKLFYSSHFMTACCFHPMNHNIVFAGLDDGSINLWDLKEDEQWHGKIHDKENQIIWIIRSPTYTTAANAEIDAAQHHSTIVSIRVLSKFHEINAVTDFNNHFAVIQICSMDEEGHIMVWTVLRSMGSNIEDTGLAHWGNIRLVKSQDVALKFAPKKNQTYVGGYVDMNVDSMDNNNLYIATNTRQVLHATCIGNKTIPLVYAGNEMGSYGNTTCIEVCPFERPYFLVGCDDGTIRLHTSNAVQPLVQLKDGHYGENIKALQWSRSRPFIIYVLDDTSRLHVWNFSISDVRPIFTVPTKNFGYVESIHLSAWKTERDMNYQYLALGMRTGDVWIHKLKADFQYSRQDDLNQEMTTFIRYISLLQF